MYRKLQAQPVLQHDTYHPLLPFIPKTLPPNVPLKYCCAECDQPNTTPGKTPSLLTCSRCMTVTYCSHEHQQKHFASHKKLCRYVSKCRRTMDNLYKELPVDINVDHVGCYGRVHEGRALLNAKRDYMLALTATRTRLGVSLALVQGLQCLQLNRMDDLGIRNAVPALMLMLGKRQECYDFIKWWATFDPSGNVDLNDLSVPMFTIKNADMKENIPDAFYNPRTSVFHRAALAFIKIGLAFEAEAELEARMFGGDDMSGLIGMLKAVVMLPYSMKMSEEVVRRKTDATKAAMLTSDVNEYYWLSVLDVHSLRDVKSPGYFKRGEDLEVQNWLIPHGLLWSQYPIGIQFIQLYVIAMASA